MNSEKPTADLSGAARTLLKKLESDFSAFQAGLPLAIGIDKQILAQLPDIDRKVLRLALSMHTKSTRYLKQTKQAKVRVNLDGSPATELAEEHRVRATEMLRERQKKIAEHHKAKRAEEEAERKRTAKLSQLVEKFGRQKP